MSKNDSGARRKPLLVVLAILAITAVVALGAFATFTDSDTATQTVATGTVSITINDSALTGKVADPVVNMAAGDTRERAFVLDNASSLPLSVLTVTAAPTPGSETDDLITDPEGLEVTVSTCDEAYTETAGQTIGDVSGISTFACGGAEDVGTANRVEDATPVSVINHDSVVAGVQDAGADEFVKVTLSLPQAADNNLQAQSTSVTYTVNATQRLAQNI